MPRARRAARDEQVVGDALARPGRAQRPHQLEVLEQHVPVVAADAPVDVHAHAERARPVAARRARDQAAPAVEQRVPGRGLEVVLRPHDVRAVEQRRDAAQLERLVAHVVVGDHRLRSAHAAQSGHHARDLAVEIDAAVFVDRDVHDRVRPGGRMVREHVGRRAVHDDHRQQPHERIEVSRQLVARSDCGAADRQHVRRLGKRGRHCTNLDTPAWRLRKRRRPPAR